MLYPNNEEKWAFLLILLWGLAIRRI